jgi:hypothetical protein
VSSRFSLRNTADISHPTPKIPLNATGSYKGGWDAARPELAKRYSDSGYPDMAKFIETV